MKKIRLYQESPWYVKLYRRARHMPSIPFRAFNVWRAQKKHCPTHEEFWAMSEQEQADSPFPRMSFAQCYKLCKGVAHMKMHWYYNWEEVRAQLEERLEEVRNDQVS